MSRSSLSVERFRSDYRELIEELVRLAGADPAIPSTWQDRLLEAPLAFPRELARRKSFATLKQRFVELARGVTTGLDEIGTIARSVVQSVLDATPARAGRATGAAPVTDADDFVPRGIGLEPAPEPQPHARRGWAHAMPPLHEDDGEPAVEENGGLLGMEPPVPAAAPAAVAAEAPAPPRAAPPEPPETRFMNAQIADHETDAPLSVGEAYVLELWVDLEKKGDASARMPDANLLFRDDEQVVELTIQVTGEDFEIGQDALPLKLPRRGRSKGRARFDVTPKRDGRRTLTATVHKEGNFLMQLELTYSVGQAAAAPASVTVNGRVLTAAAQLQKRELGMTIRPAPGGYDCLVRGATHTSVVLPLSEVELADAIKAARDAMMSVVAQRDVGELVFQKGIKVSDASRDRALRTLAQAGADLFQRLFFGPAAGPEVQKIGELIRKYATEPGKRLNFQVVAVRFPVPWGLLYMGDASDAAVIDPDLFLGMRHIIEQIPLQAGMLVDDTVIDSGKPALAVSVNVNADIDGKMKLDGVARQLAFWRDSKAALGARMTVEQRQTRGDILAALRGQTNDQLMYLYCHAVTNTPADPGGIRGSGFLFTGDERLTLADLNREAPMTAPLPGNPLVFINACESAELRPEFYDGFIPYFMAKGARGVVGTECKTPAVFATEWALQFFPRFLDGAPLGELFLELRREFNQKQGNPLGLLYNVYCDGDTRIQPGLTI